VSPAVPTATAPAPAPAPGVGALTVPRSVSLTESLLETPGDGLSAAELVALRDDLGRDLQAVIADLPPGERLEIDSFRMRVARHQPERCMSTDEPFAPSPRTCRRAVGIAAVSRCVRGHALHPALAVAEVLAAGMDDLQAAPGTGGGAVPWWASWYASLSLGGRAVVCAEATAWATQLFTAVEWKRIPRPPVVGGRDDWWQCPGGRPLVLKGRAEVRVAAERRTALLVVGSGRCPDDWRVELGFPGLVAALVRDAQASPSRVVGLWPQSGQVRELVLDIPALRASATAVVAAVATWVDGRIEAGRTPSGDGADRL